MIAYLKAIASRLKYGRREAIEDHGNDLVQDVEFTAAFSDVHLIFRMLGCAFSELQ